MGPRDQDVHEVPRWLGHGHVRLELEPQPVSEGQIETQVGPQVGGYKTVHFQPGEGQVQWEWAESFGYW